MEGNPKDKKINKFPDQIIPLNEDDWKSFDAPPEQKEENPWSWNVGSAANDAFDELNEVYKGQVPDDVYREFLQLKNELRDNYDKASDEEFVQIAAKLRNFIAEQRAAAEERKSQANEPKVEITPEPEKVEPPQEQPREESGVASIRIGDPKNPWGANIGSARITTSREFLKLFDGKEMPNDILDTFINLADEQEKNFELGDTAAQAETARKIEAFMARQRAAAEAREVQPKEAEDKEPEDKKEEREEGEEIEKQIRKEEVEEAEEHEPLSEGTHKELMDRLRRLIEGAGEKISGSFEKGKNYLADRKAELDAEIEKSGKTEGAFRWLGEQYNKRDWKAKLAIGVGLGVGAAASSAFSMPVALSLCVGGLVTQRVAGLSSMFMKYERDFLWDKWGKEKALGKAIAYQAATTAAITGAVYYGSEAIGWLKDHWPGHEAAAPGAPEAPSLPPVVEHAPKIPSIAVDASPGHGYEWMVKRIWEQLQDKGLDPSKFGEDTDIHKLLTADEKTIDSVVHRIAMDSKHGFFNPDGTSVQINLDDHLTLNQNGDIYKSDIGYGGYSTNAPADAAVTPAYPPETPVAPAAPEPPAPSSRGISATPSVEPPPKPAEAPAALVEKAAPPTEPEAPEAPSEAPAPEAEVPVEEAAPAAAAGAGEAITNQFGVAISLDEPHFYADAKGEHIFVFGGSSADKANSILEYLTANPNQTVYSADDTGTYRIPWNLVEEKAIPGKPVETGGFLGFFRSFMGAPTPNEFEKLIK